MNREMVIERLNMLVSLIEKSDIVARKNELGEPGEYEDDAKRLGKINLFNEHLITTLEHIDFIRDLSKKTNTTSKDSERLFMISTMRGANRLWKLHHKVIAGEVDSIEILELEDNINDYLEYLSYGYNFKTNSCFNTLTYLNIYLSPLYKQSLLLFEFLLIEKKDTYLN